MANVTARTFDAPDETRTADKTTFDIVSFGNAKVGRMTAQPGWRWSECVGSLLGKDTCHSRHFGMVLSGRLHVVHEDGTELEVGPGDVYVFEPGHDGWVVGDEPYVFIEFESASVDGFPTSPA